MLAPDLPLKLSAAGIRLTGYMIESQLRVARVMTEAGLKASPFAKRPMAQAAAAKPAPAAKKAAPAAAKAQPRAKATPAPKPAETKPPAGHEIWVPSHDKPVGAIKRTGGGVQVTLRHAPKPGFLDWLAENGELLVVQMLRQYEAHRFVEDISDAVNGEQEDE